MALVLAGAGVDQDRVLGRAHDKGLVGDVHPAGHGIEHHGVQFGEVPAANRRIVSREHVLRFPPWSVPFDDAGDGDVADFKWRPPLLVRPAGQKAMLDRARPSRQQLHARRCSPHIRRFSRSVSEKSSRFRDRERFRGNVKSRHAATFVKSALVAKGVARNFERAFCKECGSAYGMRIAGRLLLKAINFSQDQFTMLEHMFKCRFEMTQQVSCKPGVASAALH